MTAPGRAEVIDSLQLLVDRLRADPSIPVPAIGRLYGPVTFYSHESAEPAGARTIAESLGVTGAVLRNLIEEDDDWPYIEVTGMLGALHVRIAAEDGPVMSVPLPGGRIVRLEPIGEAAL